MPVAGFQLLRECVTRGAGVVLSLPCPGGLIHYKSRFLPGEGDELWVAATGELSEPASLIPPGGELGVSFRSGGSRHVFASRVQRHNLSYRISAVATAPAILLEFPTEVHTLQRRASYRVQLSPDSDLSVCCWRMAKRGHLRDRPRAGTELKLEVHDISMGGLGITLLGENKSPPRISSEDRLRIEMRVEEAQLLLEGRMRAPTGASTPGTIRSGIRFVYLQDGVEDRHAMATLSRIIGELQRQEARYQRIVTKARRTSDAA